MPLIFACNGCGKKYKAGDQLAGKRLRCKCGTVITVPSAVPVPVPVPEELDLSSVSGLLSASGLIPEVSPATPCPSCSAPLQFGAVLCMACGYNTQTGKHLAAASAGKKAKAKPKKDKTAKPARDDSRPSIGSRLLKLSLVLVVVGGIGAFGWYVRDAVRHNPAAEAKATKDKIFPGMTIEEVIKVTELPPREVWIEEADKSPGNTLKVPKRVRIGYQDDFLKSQPAERLADGFEFVWKFSERDFLRVFFSSEGKVDSTDIFNPMAALGM